MKWQWREDGEGERETWRGKGLTLSGCQDSSSWCKILKSKLRSISWHLRTKQRVNTLPVQPGEQALGGRDEVDHRRQQVVREPPWGPALRLAATTASGDEVLQVFGRGAELVSQSPDALRLQTGVLHKHSDISTGESPDATMNHHEDKWTSYFFESRVCCRTMFRF